MCIRDRYAARMFIFALISEIPFDLAINNTVLEFKSNNVFFTLLLGLLAITAVSYTHLDVYKRQLQQLGQKMLILPG